MKTEQNLKMHRYLKYISDSLTTIAIQIYFCVTKEE